MKYIWRKGKFESTYDNNEFGIELDGLSEAQSVAKYLLNEVVILAQGVLHRPADQRRVPHAGRGGKMICPLQPGDCSEECALWMDYQCAIKAIAIAMQCSVGAISDLGLGKLEPSKKEESNG
jgi:hypothetical protein